MRSILLFVSLLIVPAIVRADVTARDPAVPTISVTGAADVKVTPDRVVLTLGIWSRTDSLDEAKADNDRRMKAVLAYLRRSGVGPQQIRTDFLAVNPNVDWGYSSRKYTYDVRRNIVVTLDHPDRFEGILAGAVANGVDVVVSVKFQTTQLKKYREQARALAIRAAREKAEKLTAELGTRVGEVQTIQEDRSGEESGWNWWDWYWGGGPHGMSQIQVSAPSPRGDAFDTLALGEIPVSASVKVTFTLLPGAADRAAGR